MKMKTPDGVETDVHPSSVERKENAGWKKVGDTSTAKAKPKTKSTGE